MENRWYAQTAVIEERHKDLLREAQQHNLARSARESWQKQPNPVIRLFAHLNHKTQRPDFQTAGTLDLVKE